MAEENGKLEVNDNEEVIVENEANPEYSDIELQAIDKGWNPEGVEGKKNLSADEFLDRQSLYDEINKLKRSLKQNKKVTEDLAEHHKKVAEIERKKALEDLQKAKKVALKNEDHDAVVDIDDQIMEIKVEGSKKVEEQQDVEPPEFTEWVSTNQWYNTNDEMRVMADDMGNGFAARNPNASLEDVFRYVSTQIKRVFPEEFENPRKKAAQSVEGGATGGRSKSGKGSSKRFTKADLNDDQVRAMNGFVRSGIMDEAEYIEELVKIGELG